MLKVGHRQAIFFFKAKKHYTSFCGLVYLCESERFSTVVVQSKYYYTIKMGIKKVKLN